ncbi:MAG TPA: SRPBCC domain-containing protein [Candidatus Cybelea sp.]|jgi:uncharacterized protein YndB with AHSA1/START domain|nr:SRPBCC domain-containing protein [Candidatus Cybelea sp.]
MKTDGKDEVLTFQRVVDAPRPIVWQAWTDPKHAAKWWGPAGATVPVFEADLRTGGSFRIEIEHSGNTSRVEGIYEEIVEPERLVTSGSLTRNGTKLCDTRRIVTFEDDNGKTAIAVQQTFFNLAPEAGDMSGGTKAGMEEYFDRLEAHLRR